MNTLNQARQALLSECTELLKIFSASLATVKRTSGRSKSLTR